MPSNKIGGLKAGQGLRRIQAQRMGGWRDMDAKANYEIGSELTHHVSHPGANHRRSSRWRGAKD